MISISQQHNEDRLQGTLNHLLRGAGTAKVRIYAAPRPAAITDAPAGPYLCSFNLTAEIGFVSAGKLLLTNPPDALVALDGTAAWARITNQEDAASIDCDVSDLLGSGEIKLQTINLLAGGSVRLVSAEFG